MKDYMYDYYYNADGTKRQYHTCDKIVLNKVEIDRPVLRNGKESDYICDADMLRDWAGKAISGTIYNIDGLWDIDVEGMVLQHGKAVLNISNPFQLNGF